jgi:electron transport complex protein RnfG
MKKTLPLIASLTIISAVCAAVLATVDAVTKKQIAAIREKAAFNAAKHVIPPVKTLEKIKGQNGEEDAFIGKNAAGKIVACAVVGKDTKGYGGLISLMVGFTPEKKIIGYKKLEAYETPGLGMNLTAESFVRQFKGMDATHDIKTKKDGGEVDVITSATITTRAVCRAINAARRRMEKILADAP